MRLILPVMCGKENIIPAVLLCAIGPPFLKAVSAIHLMEL